MIMRQIKKILTFGICILMLSGCSTVNKLKFWEDDRKKMPPLPAVQEKISLKEMSGQRVGRGSRGQYLALTPVIADDVLYATDAKGVVEAVDVKSQKQLWKTKLKVPVTGSVGVGQSLVVLGTRKGEVIALDQANGLEKWRTQVDGEILSSPGVSRAAIVVQTSNNHVFGLDPETGNIHWRFESSAPALTLRTTSHPALSDRMGVVGQSNGHIVAFDLKTGERKWEQPLMIGRGRSELQRMVDVNGELALSNGILYASSYQGRIGAFDVESGRPFWQREMSTSTGVTLVNENAIAVADSSGVVWLLDADTGATIWKQEKLKQRLLTRPTVVGNTVIVSDQEGIVHALNLEDGELVGRKKLGRKPIYAPAIQGDEENEFFILDSAGKLKAYHLG